MGPEEKNERRERPYPKGMDSESALSSFPFGASIAMHNGTLPWPPPPLQASSPSSQTPPLSASAFAVAASLSPMAAFHTVVFYAASPLLPPLLASLSLCMEAQFNSIASLNAVIDESKETEMSGAVIERSESDKLVDSMKFGELCNEFVCVSSPLVEATARQLVRDILQLREGNRALGCFATSVKYKDPLRTFVGRDKYKRPLWATSFLENPTVTVQEMTMLSTSELSIKWTLKGKAKNPIISSLGGYLILRVDSKFVLNQISGQVMEHTESWDLSASSLLAQGYFWVSRRLFSANEAGKDTIDSVKSNMSRLSQKQENVEIYPDPTGDPTKFFQRDDGLQRDVYQIAIFLALIYFVVQFLRATL